MSRKPISGSRCPALPCWPSPSPPAARAPRRDPVASGGASGSVAVDGSSTVFPMSNAAYELLNEENPDIKVTVGSAGTGGGFEKFCAGQTDISDASRPIKDDEEVPVCEKNKVDFTELQVATDALTVVVNKDLEGVDCLTTDQLIKLWAPGSKINNWNQLDPKFPNQKISLFGPGTDSGTYDYMAADVIGDESEKTARRLRGQRGRQRPGPGRRGHRGSHRLLRLHVLRGERRQAEGGRHRRRQGLCEAVGRDRPGRRVHPARAPAVHLRRQQGVHGQQGRQGVHRLLHREPRDDREGGASSSRSTRRTTARPSPPSMASADAETTRAPRSATPHE